MTADVRYNNQTARDQQQQLQQRYGRGNVSSVARFTHYATDPTPTTPARRDVASPIESPPHLNHANPARSLARTLCACHKRASAAAAAASSTAAAAAAAAAEMETTRAEQWPRQSGYCERQVQSVGRLRSEARPASSV